MSNKASTGARLSSMHTPLPPDRFGEPALTLREVSGREAISSLFAYRVLAHSMRADLCASDVLGQRVHLQLQDQDGKPCELDAVVKAFSCCGQERDVFLYELELAPWLWLAAQNADCRCFQEMDTREIINQVMQAYPWPLRWQLSLPLHKREFCVQYNESDFAFISRLLEDEGLSYYFEHEAERHTMVCHDFLAPSRSIAGHDSLPYLSSASQRVHAREALRAARQRLRLRSGRHVTGDFDFKKPRQTKWNKYAHPKQHVNAESEVFQWPGRFQAMSDGAQRARHRQEEQQSLHQVIVFESDVRAAAFGASGAHFALSGHPQAEYNRRMIVYASQMRFCENPGHSKHASAAPEWRISLHALPMDCQLRPARRTPWPCIAGVQTAIVSTPGEHEIWTNQYGQVRIKFHWDRLAQEDGRDSCWVRVSSSWAGQAYGELMLPRKGQEVIVSFIDGNPDRPIITGRVHNGAQHSERFANASALPGDVALAGVKSRELGGAAYNQWLFDDTTGQVRAQFASSHGKSQLNLGWLAQPRSQSKAAPRGEGFELRSDHTGAVRAAQGLLLSTEAQSAENGPQLARTTLLDVTQQALQQARAQAQNAAMHQAGGGDLEPQERLSKALQNWHHGSNLQARGEGGQTPLAALSALAGFALATPESGLLATGKHLDCVAEQHLQSTAGQDIHQRAGRHLTLFAQSGDVKSIAHQGKHIIQAQHNDVLIAAEKLVQISSSASAVTVLAQQQIKLICGGSYLLIKPDGIELGTGGTISMKAAHIDYQGAAKMEAELPQFGQGETEKRFVLKAGNTDTVLANAEYIMQMADGQIIKGVTDALGQTEKALKDSMQVATIQFLGKKT
ncbi:type VI secretion system tip protein TssI/VgrG [Massilia sp. W12]|uniref:type VI secretion system Vgr family protein n=1 Tax=Massilia sp. W12 TaxID=3126507 RepID=UPI0030D2CDC5